MKIQVQSTNQRSLGRLTELAREACQLAYDYEGTNWQDVGLLRAYNADSSNHKSFEFRGVGVSFHSPIEFEFTAYALEHIEDIIEEVEAELAEYKARQVKTAEEARQEQRAARKAQLEKQLAELENEDE
jgi:hypothetical protein